MELSAISPMYMGTVAVTPPMTAPAISRATYSSQTVVAKKIIAQLMMNGTASAAMVGFRPNMSAPLPAGMDPMIAPIAISEPTHEPCSGVIGILEFFASNMGSTGDVHASTVPTANGPMVAANNDDNNVNILFPTDRIRRCNSFFCTTTSAVELLLYAFFRKTDGHILFSIFLSRLFVIRRIFLSSKLQSFLSVSHSFNKHILHGRG